MKVEKIQELTDEEKRFSEVNHISEEVMVFYKFIYERERKYKIIIAILICLLVLIGLIGIIAITR